MKSWAENHRPEQDCGAQNVVGETWRCCLKCLHDTVIAITPRVSTVTSLCSEELTRNSKTSAIYKLCCCAKWSPNSKQDNYSSARGEGVLSVQISADNETFLQGHYSSDGSLLCRDVCSKEVWEFLWLQCIIFMESFDYNTRESVSSRIISSYMPDVHSVLGNQVEMAHLTRCLSEWVART